MRAEVCNLEGMSGFHHITKYCRRKEFHDIVNQASTIPKPQRGGFPKHTRLQALLLPENTEAAACCDNTKIIISVSSESGIYPFKGTPFP